MLIYCCSHCGVGFSVWYLVCCTVLSIVLCFAIISLGKRDLVAFLYNVTVVVLCLFLTVPWIGLQCVIAAFPGDIHLLFLLYLRILSY